MVERVDVFEVSLAVWKDGSVVSVSVAEERGGVPKAESRTTFRLSVDRKEGKIYTHEEN